jgi:hypothetical protein
MEPAWWIAASTAACCTPAAFDSPIPSIGAGTSTTTSGRVGCTRTGTTVPFTGTAKHYTDVMDGKGARHARFRILFEPAVSGGPRVGGRLKGTRQT